MPQKCAAIGCFNRSDNKDRWVVMPHVTELSFHSCPDSEHLHIWAELIAGGHRRPKDFPAHGCVCSNHFPLGRPCSRSPFPIVYLRGYEDEGEQVTVRILRDTMNTDHDYPKLSYGEEGEKPRGVLPVPCEEDVEERVVKQLSEDAVPAWVRGVGDTVQCGNGQLGNRPGYKQGTDALNTTSASHQPAAAAAAVRSREELCAAKLPQAKYQPDSPPNLISSDTTENSAMVIGGRQFRGRKRRNSRDTDHMYNTRTAKSAKCNQGKKMTDRSTDHQYNSRKVKTVENSFPHTGSNRYTDHMYNMPRTKLNELNNSAASGQSSDCKAEEKPRQETSAVVDMRAVDKDHMYQHSVRKSRNKLDSKNVDGRNHQTQATAPTKKVLKHEVKNADVRTEESKAEQSGTKSENSSFPVPVSESKTGSRTGSQRTKRGRKPLKGSAKKKKMSAALTEASLAEDAGPDKTVQATSTVTASPVHSDNESDLVSESDQQRTGVWPADHMYVHLNTNILERKGQSALNPWFSAEGYKQEHSYANSVEVRYDACVNCSQLVQQLIGTIRQQGDHIDDMKKKLRAANARNKQLTSLVSQKCENAE